MAGFIGTLQTELHVDKSHIYLKLSDKRNMTSILISPLPHWVLGNLFHVVNSHNGKKNTWRYSMSLVNSYQGSQLCQVLHKWIWRQTLNWSNLEMIWALGNNSSLQVMKNLDPEKSTDFTWILDPWLWDSECLVFVATKLWSNFLCSRK